MHELVTLLLRAVVLVSLSSSISGCGSGQNNLATKSDSKEANSVHTLDPTIIEVVLNPRNSPVKAASPYGPEKECGEGTRAEVNPQTGPQRATCLILAEFANGNQFHGTGFIVAPRLVV